MQIQVCKLSRVQVAKTFELELSFRLVKIGSLYLRRWSLIKVVLADTAYRLRLLLLNCPWWSDLLWKQFIYHLVQSFAICFAVGDESFLSGFDQCETPFESVCLNICARLIRMYGKSVLDKYFCALFIKSLFDIGGSHWVLLHKLVPLNLACLFWKASLQLADQLRSLNLGQRLRLVIRLQIYATFQIYYVRLTFCYHLNCAMWAYLFKFYLGNLLICIYERFSSLFLVQSWFLNVKVCLRAVTNSCLLYFSDFPFNEKDFGAENKLLRTYR